MDTEIEGITREALDSLKKYTWQGNVRELENTIIKAAITTKDRLISRDSLGELLATTQAIQSSDSLFDFASLKTLKEFEKSYIGYVLINMDWQKMKTASILGISRPTLDKKIIEYNIVKND